jgi:hypothetical protein
METAEVQRLVAAVGGVDPACRDRDVLCAAVAAAARLRSWLDGQDVRLAGQLAEVVSFPEQALAEAARTSLRDASRVLDRARTVDALPAFAHGLASGALSGSQVDVVGTALRRLEPVQRGVLLDRADRLAASAAQCGLDEFRQLVAGEVRRIQRDDGMARLERQKRATRLRSWVDRDGMWCLSARFDPDNGVRLHHRLTATVDSLFVEAVPEHCPSDPLERQGFLRAHALLALTDRHGARSGRPEIIVVVDTTAPDPAGGPTVDWGLPVELPSQTLLDLFAGADTHPVIVRDGAVVYAPGQSHLGRTTRLASRAQRRALRAVYPTCAIPSCTVSFERCTIHHVIAWDDDGPTDLPNLLPLCNSHHHATHDRGWELRLDPDRTLTITYPDGTRHVARPPRRRLCHDPPAA